MEEVIGKILYFYDYNDVDCGMVRDIITKDGKECYKVKCKNHKTKYIPLDTEDIVYNFDKDSLFAELDKMIRNDTFGKLSGM